MKLYHVLTLHDGHIFVGTQADAKRVAKEEHAAGWEAVEVPTNKAGLIAHLNSMAGASQMPQERDSSACATQVAPEPQKRADGAPTCSQIEEFLFGPATVAEVERIFTAIGTRFAELRR